MVIKKPQIRDNQRLNYDLLTHKDSNLECRYQKPMCYRLHHGSKSDGKNRTFPIYKKYLKGIYHMKIYTISNNMSS